MESQTLKGGRGFVLLCVLFFREENWSRKRFVDQARDGGTSSVLLFFLHLMLLKMSFRGNETERTEPRAYKWRK